MTDDLARPASRRLQRRDLASAVPDLSSPQRLPGPEGARGRLGVTARAIPDARAGSLHDAFFAQGWVHAQDRLWQMEYDRRRAYGRWAELAGPDALTQDVQMRRFHLEASARADYAAAGADTRAMLDAYAAGVNALIGSARALAGGVRSGRRPSRALAAVGQCRRLQGAPCAHGALAGQGLAGAARPPSRSDAGGDLCPGVAPDNPMLILPPGIEYRGGRSPATEAL